MGAIQHTPPTADCHAHLTVLSRLIFVYRTLKKEVVSFVSHRLTCPAGQSQRNLTFPYSHKVNDSGFSLAPRKKLGNLCFVKDEGIASGPAGS